MLSSNRLVSAFKPWEPVCNDGHSVENAVERGESSSLKCITEGIATVSLNFKDSVEDTSHTTSGIDEQTSIVTSMKRAKLTSIGSNDKHLKPSKKSKSGISSDDPSVSSVGKSKEVSNPPAGQSWGCNSQEANTSDQTFDNIENLPHGNKMLDKSRKGVELNRPLMNSARKNSKLTVGVGDVEALTQGGTGDLTKEPTPESVEKQNDIKDLSIPVVIGLQCKALTYSRTKKQLGPPLAPETTGNVEVTEVDTNSITKRKRGRPRKLPLKIPETSLAVNHQNGDALQGLGFVEGSKMNASIKVESGKENPEVNVDKPLNRSSGKALTVQHEKPKIVKGRRGKRRTISSINIEASPQDCQDSSKQKANGGLETDGTAGNSEPSVEKYFDTMSDDQPLSRWFEGMHSATTVDSTVAAQQRKVEQSSDASKKQLENLEICPAVANGEMVADDGGNLSFVKSSPLWETLESMEVFRMIPQNPHFRLLNSLKESAREGQAISQMVNFSKVVENTSQLRFDCPRNTIEECLEVLVELEIHGFDVKLIRDRLTGLLLIKDKQEELEARWKEVGDKIERVNVEGGRDDEEIELLDKKIRELLERRSQILAKKEKMGSEQGGLEVEIDGIKEGLNEIRYKFDGLAAASLCPP
ncbi:DUF724 domain-containing protein 3-like isoform X1 [Cynara cardunculus var. scolymus]|uniref:DUF724 domain-containing protein 3-like isoform X1 n=2 Tax=Cynara cardunculus var. scolymus TaxID=59895 RepID=UPI000D62C16E|nr:DUF724 domain-containing protein 3-like isoform X1 [Cynara cardunculus var. scolymus]